MLVDLAGEWHLKDNRGDISAPMRVPGDGISALHDAGLIPDPYFGRNEYDLRWICDRGWVISRSFVVDRVDLVLVVSMLDTLAEVVVNGVSVLRAVNDTAASVDLTVEALAVDMAGKTMVLARQMVTVSADAAVSVMHISAADVEPQEMLAYVWLDANGQRVSGDVFAPKPHKAYDLLPAGLTYVVARTGPNWQITIEAAALALFVSLEADVAGRFSINAFTLFPGHPVTVTFTPATAGPAPNFTLRDLRSATYGPA